MHNHTLQNFFREWFKSLRHNQRLGQALCNYFDLQDDILFYEEDPYKARERFHAFYINA